ncbi:alpha/beta hydrolase [Cellvibrio zantedeschiae]|uniref:Alpha/beta hydrolase n=1 Tax=Cellvibrio zantedeschiae TaxID=1237077 RepID=A0ABQ3B2Y2_9GAMM|nr:alpha/beta hydrolase [Cellvibrio zantedeschiae]GGY76869.1 alpha/beta hydrolase [Cellvibrio zantedeschiae]
MTIDLLFVHSAGLQIGGQGSAPFVEQLRRDLGAAYKISFPIMPAPSKPSYLRWKYELKNLLHGESSPKILIGHSLGGSVLLKYLSELPDKISASGLFIVAAPFWGSENWTLDEFLLRDDFAKSLPKSLKIFLYHSKDDDMVPFSHLDYYRKAIPQAEVRELDTGEHSFKKGLPELTRDIQKLSASLGN